MQQGCISGPVLYRNLCTQKPRALSKVSKPKRLTYMASAQSSSFDAAALLLHLIVVVFNTMFDTNSLLPTPLDVYALSSSQAVSMT